ncbi:Uncharacterised protein [Shigella sonnei]|nr:Uncharacterised protein [Shigella sonnei]
MTLRRQPGKVSTELLYHCKKCCWLLGVTGIRHIEFPLHPAYRQQNVFRVFLQCCLRAEKQILI